MADDRRGESSALMLAFTERTGLTSARPPERYLWTDAFAVCSFLGLGEMELALRLVEQVHEVLGRHREDDGRAGWISGLSDTEGAAHPTRGGLRIGKKLPERQPAEPLDERLEWERDGQYFHYLTKWMHALDQVARRTGEPKYNVWARDLALAAHRAFTYAAGDGGRRMYWKMSVDLARPVITSMGHHDPLDGHVTCVQLEATAHQLAASNAGPSMAEATADFRAMIPRDLLTVDPLGLGGLLTDAWRLEQLRRQGAIAGTELRDRTIRAAASGLNAYEQSGELRLGADFRLAFRELGLAIGLAAAPQMDDAGVARFVGLRHAIDDFWLDPANRESTLWLEHRNINDVMLATSLVPDGYVTLAR